MRKFKTLKGKLNKCVTMLVTIVMVLSCMGVFPISADVAEGSAMPTFDDLWTQLKTNDSTATLPYTLNGTTCNGDASLGYWANRNAQESITRLGYEDANNTNLVLMGGDGTTHTGTIVYRKMDADLGTTRKQKWEVKVKLASNTDVVDLFHYASNQYTVYDWYSSTGNATSVQIDSGNVKVHNGTEWKTIYSNIVPNAWYKVERYMDFSTDGVNMQRVLIYDATGNKIADSGSTWLKAGVQTYTSGNNASVRTIGLQVTKADNGAVMFDDLAAYAMEAAPKMSVVGSYNVEGPKNTTTIDGMTIGTPTGNYAAEILTSSSATVRKNKLEIAMDGENKVLKTTNGGTDAAPDYSGGLSFRTEIHSKLTREYNQMWEVKVKLPAADYDVRVLPYTTNYYWLIDYNYGSVTTPVQLINGTAKVYNGAAGQWIDLYTGLEAGQWYKIVRYMNFSTKQVNMGRSQIFKVNSDGTETLVADTIVELQTGTADYKYNGTSIDATVYCIGVDVMSAKGTVMFDDLNFYKSTPYSIGTENVSIDGTELSLNFDKEMKESSFDASAITLKTNGINVPLDKAEYNKATNSIVVKYSNLDYGRQYTLTVAKEVMCGVDTLGLNPDEDFVYTFTTEADPRSVGTVTLKNDSNADMSSASSLDVGDKIKGSATIINESSIPRPYNVILVIYKGTQMVNITAASGNIANTTAEGSTIETPTLEIKEAGCTAEVLVWDSWEGLRPLASEKVVPTPAS